MKQYTAAASGFFGGLPERIASRVVRRRWWVLALSGLLVLVSFGGLPKLRIDAAGDSFLDQHASALASYRQFEARFGTDNVSFVLVTAPDVYTPRVLNHLLALQARIRASVPYVLRTDSLANALDTSSPGSPTFGEPLLTAIPSTPGQSLALRIRVASLPLVSGVLADPSGHWLALMVTAAPTDSASQSPSVNAGATPLVHTLSTAQAAQFARSLRTVVTDVGSDGIRSAVAGSQVNMTYLMDQFGAQMGLFTGLSLLATMVLLLAVFRRASAAVLGFAIVLVSLLGTLGAMGWIGEPLTGVTQILPSLLVVVSVAAGVHVLAAFYRHFDAGVSRSEAVVKAVAQTGTAVFFTSATTAVGLASFVISGVAPIAGLGKAGPLGVAISIVATLVVVPAVICVVPLRRRGHPIVVPVLDSTEVQRAGVPASAPSRLSALLVSVANASHRRPGVVIGITLALLGMSAAGMAQLVVRQDPVGWFPANSPLRTDLATIESNFGGSLQLEIVVDSGSPGGMAFPASLATLSSLNEIVDTSKVSGHPIKRLPGIVEVLEEQHHLQYGPRSLPTSSSEIAADLAELTTSGANTRSWFDQAGQRAVISIVVPSVSILDYQHFGNVLAQELHAASPPGWNVQVTGIIPVLGQSFNLLLPSMLSSYWLALIVVALVMILVMGSIRTGLLAMIPDLVPVALTLGLAGWLRIPLDIFTLLIGSILIGLAGDDTIHLTRGIRAHQKSGAKSDAAISSVMRTIGLPAVFSSCVLASGFAVFLPASLNNLRQFGLLATFGVITGLVADLTLLPVLVRWFPSKRPTYPPPLHELISDASAIEWLSTQDTLSVGADNLIHGDHYGRGVQQATAGGRLGGFLA